MNTQQIKAVIKSKLKTGIKKLYYRTSIPLNKLLKNEYIRYHDNISIEPSNICNLNCIFCGYSKYKGSRALMPNDNFKVILDTVVNAGYTSIAISPLTGEVFIDPSFLIKLDTLELTEQIKEFSFTTNFTSPSLETLTKLITYKKLKAFTISLYGHDLDSFKIITKGNEDSYNSLVRNLNFLLDNINSIDINIQLGMRSYGTFNLNKCDSELCNIIKKLIKFPNICFTNLIHYTNWAGAITQEDVAGTDIILKDDKNGYKNGPCSVLFSHLITSTGKVLACACRDAHRELEIGDINITPIEEIISINNKKYTDIIDEQKNNIYRSPCKDCDMYRSIYACPPNLLFKKTSTKFIDMKEYFDKKS